MVGLVTGESAEHSSAHAVVMFNTALGNEHAVWSAVLLKSVMPNVAGLAMMSLRTWLRLPQASRTCWPVRAFLRVVS